MGNDGLFRRTFPINVVGGIGFLDHTQVVLVDYEQLLYLSPYVWRREKWRE